MALFLISYVELEFKFNVDFYAELELLHCYETIQMCNLQFAVIAKFAVIAEIQFKIVSRGFSFSANTKRRHCSHIVSTLNHKLSVLN